MANFDLVTTYDAEDAEYFRGRGLPHPPVLPNNQMPTTADLLWALDSLDSIGFDRPPRGEEELRVRDENGRGCLSVGGFDWDAKNTIPGDSFILRGYRLYEFALLIRLCERCGQLLLTPDSGESAVVLDSSMDAEELDRLHEEFADDPDGWSHFFEAVYGSA